MTQRKIEIIGVVIGSIFLAAVFGFIFFGYIWLFIDVVFHHDKKNLGSLIIMTGIPFLGVLWVFIASRWERWFRSLPKR